MSTDAELVSRITSGDSDAIQQVQVWVREGLYPYRARTQLAEREDLEQEVLLALLGALQKDQFQARSTLRTYVRKFVHYKCIDLLRAKTRREFVDVGVADQLPSSGNTEQDYASRENVLLSLEALKSTPERCRELWALIREGRSAKEMAQMLGLRESTVRTRVRRCRRQAKAALERLKNET